MNELGAPVLTVTLNPALDKTLVVERFDRGRVNRVRESRIDPGGKGINVSKILAQVGYPTVAMGFLAGVAGKHLHGLVTEMGLETDFVWVEGETRTNLKLVEMETGVGTDINEQGPVVSPSALDEFTSRFEARCRTSGAVVLSGSLPLGIPADYYRTLGFVARDAGLLAILDAQGEALRLGLEAQPFAVKPNLDEAAELLGTRLDSQDDAIRAAESFVSRGAKLAVISMGPVGAVAATHDSRWRIRPPEVRVVSSAGAGDAMVAGLVLGLMKGLNVEESLRLATAFAAAMVSKLGTQACGWDEIERCLPSVGIERVT